MPAIDKGQFVTSIRTRIYVKAGAAALSDPVVIADFVANDKVTAAANRLLKASAVGGLGVTGNTQSFEYFDQDEADQEAGSPTREDFVLTFADRNEDAGPQKSMIDASIGDEFAVVIEERQTDAKKKYSCFNAKVSAKARSMETGGARNSRTITFARQTEIHEFNAA